MCARYDLHSTRRLVLEMIFGPGFDPRHDRPGPPPSYNIAPTQPVLAARRIDGHPALDTLRWGLIPPWAKDASIAHRLINARCETARQKPTFRSAFKHRRCLVPADGFYEWAKLPGGKQPYYLRMADHGPFALAGLWECWRGPDDRVVETCAILTTEPNDLIRPIHDRMPVIIAPDAYAAWLDPDLEQPPAGVFAPYPADLMQAIPISKYVNNPAHNGPACLLPSRPK